MKIRARRRLMGTISSLTPTIPTSKAGNLRARVWVLSSRALRKFCWRRAEEKQLIPIRSSLAIWPNQCGFGSSVYICRVLAEVKAYMIYYCRRNLY